MRITIDGSSVLLNRTGIGHYTFNLMKWLGKLDTVNQYRFIFYSWKIRVRTLQVPMYPNYTLKDLRLPGKLLLKSWQYFKVPSLETLSGSMDLFHSPNYLYQPQKAGKTVCTLHDLAFLRFPGYGEPYGGKYFANVLPQSINRADGIIADSHATRNDILELLDVDEDRVHVIYLGIDPEYGEQCNPEKFNYLRIKLGLDKDYLLTVTTLEPRKNLDGIITAMNLLKDKGVDIPLLVCGGEGWEHQDIFKKITRMNLEHRIFFAGYVEQELLPELYRNAVVTIFPSLYEGFGLPILESMACGTPVITSNLSSMPEIAGDAALLVDPRDPEDIANAIQKSLDDTNIRQSLIQNGYERVKLFTWEQTARNTINFYEKIGS